MASNSKKPARKTTVGVGLIKLLQLHSVEHVFGIPGVHTLELYRGLSSSSIQHHTPRHEQGAGFMADGYARASGKPGVCFVITGPGLTNIATAMGQALADSIPMLVISSVNDEQRTPHTRGRLHEMPDQLAFSSQVSRFSRTLHNASELPDLLAQAFAMFSSARPGPAHVQIPISLLGSEIDEASVRTLQNQTQRPAPANQSIVTASKILNESSKPVILAGGGVVHGASTVTALAEKLDAPVCLTINAKGVLSVDHGLAVSASATLTPVRELIAQSDVVLALGTEMAATDYDQYRDGDMQVNGHLIRADIDAMQINNNYTANTGIVADAEKTAAALLDATESKDRQGKRRAEHAMQTALKKLSPQYQQHLSLLAHIRDAVPDCVLVGDSTQLVYAGNLYFNMHKPRQWFNSSTGFGTLGYALPAATGAALAGNAPVVCLIGDGGLQFVLAELGTLKDADVPVAVVVWCNGGYGEIETSMENVNVEPVGVQLYQPEFAAIAKAYGIDAVDVSDAASLSRAIAGAFSKRRSVVISADAASFA